jgi:hypothetical protein
MPAMTSVIEDKRTAIADLCRRFGVQKLDLFGSAATGDFDPSRSDLDFLVEFPAEYDFGPWMSRFQEFQEELSALVQRPVDLVRESALRNPWFRREANKTRTIIYDASKDAEVAARHS